MEVNIGCFFRWLFLINGRYLTVYTSFCWNSFEKKFDAQEAERKTNRNMCRRTGHRKGDVLLSHISKGMRKTYVHAGRFLLLKVEDWKSPLLMLFFPVEDRISAEYGATLIVVLLFQSLQKIGEIWNDCVRELWSVNQINIDSKKA